MKNFLTLLCISQVCILFAQVTDRSVFVKFIDEPIVLDAQLNEPSWLAAKEATNFWQYFPSDSTQAKQQAAIKFLFDDKNLYVGIKVNAPDNKFITPSLRRDF